VAVPSACTNEEKNNATHLQDTKYVSWGESEEEAEFAAAAHSANTRRGKTVNASFDDRK